MTKQATGVAVPKQGEIVAKQEPTPMQMIQQVIENPDFDVAKLEKMMDLQERWESKQAEKEFAKALAAFQAEVPPIKRVKKADRYHYAPIEAIMQTIRPFMEKHGLSVTFDSEIPQEGLVRVYCTVTHASGHQKRNGVTLPVDTKNVTKLNVMQIQGSVDTYGKRYALGAALGLVYCDEDDDGASVRQLITDDQAIVINDLLDELKLPKARRAKFLKWAKADSVEAISTDVYEDAVKYLTDLRDELTNNE